MALYHLTVPLFLSYHRTTSNIKVHFKMSEEQMDFLESNNPQYDCKAYQLEGGNDIF